MLKSVKLLATAVAALGGVSAAHGQTAAFYTSPFGDHQLVSLFSEDTTVAAEPGFDYDVLIEVARGSSADPVSYTDPSGHKAAVRCDKPGLVLVGGRQYQVPGLPQTDWKLALWNSICVSPSS